MTRAGALRQRSAPRTTRTVGPQSGAPSFAVDGSLGKSPSPPTGVVPGRQVVHGRRHRPAVPCDPGSHCSAPGESGSWKASVKATWLERGCSDGVPRGCRRPGECRRRSSREPRDQALPARSRSPFKLTVELSAAGACLHGTGKINGRAASADSFARRRGAGSSRGGGPVLPLLTASTRSEAVRQINAGQRPAGTRCDAVSHSVGDGQWRQESSPLVGRHFRPRPHYSTLPSDGSGHRPASTSHKA